MAILFLRVRGRGVKHCPPLNPRMEEYLENKAARCNTESGRSSAIRHTVAVKPSATRYEARLCGLADRIQRSSS